MVPELSATYMPLPTTSDFFSATIGHGRARRLPRTTFACGNPSPSVLGCVTSALANSAGNYGDGQNTIAPRIGFSWQIIPRVSRVVLRGGYGVYYSQPTGQAFF